MCAPPLVTFPRSEQSAMWLGRSEEGRVGEEGRTRWVPDHLKKKKVRYEDCDPRCQIDRERHDCRQDTPFSQACRLKEPKDARPSTISASVGFYDLRRQSYLVRR